MTLISTALKKELGLESTPDLLVTIHTLADEKVIKEGRTNVKLESLLMGKSTIKRVDILIEQSNKALLTVLEEREGKNPHQPNFLLTRLWLVASKGRVPHNSDNFFCRKVSTGKMKQKIAEFKQKFLKYEL